MLAIKGVPMPTTCENCMFGRSLMDTLGDAYCAIFPTLPTQVGVRPDWCPLEDVPQRVRGRWVGTEFDGYADGNPVYYEWKCSACGCVVEDEEPTWNYCPNCGAEMRGTE